MFGSFGETLYSLCRGIDERPVQAQSRRKSISVEHTFAEDLPSLDNCLSTLPDLMQELQHRIEKSRKQVTIGKQFVKIKFNDFVSTTVEQSGNSLDLDTFKTLCRTGFERGNKPVRLLGLGVRMKEAPRYTQLELNFKY
jgi:DNA polymerase-4